MKKKKKNHTTKRTRNRNRLAFFVMLITSVLLIFVFIVYGELGKFHEIGVTPIDQVKADEGDHNTRTPEQTQSTNDPDQSTQVEQPVSTHPAQQTEPEQSEEVIVTPDPYYELINSANRINVLCFGVAEYHLADTIMIVSLNMDDHTAAVISVPRDSYYHTAGRDAWPFRKINAHHYGTNAIERTQNLMNTVSALVKIPLHYYVKIEYEGVIEIVNSIGGVEINIPFDMFYDDPMDNLHIRFDKGLQLLDGQQAIEFLRFRMNNDGTHSDGDIGRIRRQQEFIRIAVRKSLNMNLPNVVATAQNHVRTNMTPNEMIGFATKFMNFDMNELSFYTLPGYPQMIGEGDFWVVSEESAKEMIVSIYKGLDK